MVKQFVKEPLEQGKSMRRKEWQRQHVMMSGVSPGRREGQGEGVFRFLLVSDYRTPLLTGNKLN